MSSLSSAPIVRTVVNSMRRLYPEHLADKSFDNTGLLLEAPTRHDISRQTKPKVLLTIDLTTSVANEAMKLGASVIVTYHPIIFFALKSLTLANSQQKSLLRLAQMGISVYCPHTAVDAAIGGVNDWLADGISGGRENESKARAVLQEVEGVSGTAFEGAGLGRIVTLKEAQTVGVLVDRLKDFLGMKYLQLALAGKHRSGSLISTIGICAGSGGSLLRGVKADLLLSGELSHHEALPAVESGTSVISCFHSNSERGFLAAVLKKQLEDVLPEEWKKVTEEKVGEFSGDEKWTKEKTEDLEVEGWEVVVSQADRDPYEIV